METHDFGLTVQATKRILHEGVNAHGVDVHLVRLAQPGAVFECDCIPHHANFGLITRQFSGLDKHVVERAGRVLERMRGRCRMNDVVLLDQRSQTISQESARIIAVDKFLAAQHMNVEARAIPL
ncbi:DNA-binding transcriptional regulator [Pseudomonas syringae pv. actinidiae]|uniref:DNA-binding transcriptional regulator n=1 Tax=Pseudomonas syringae pv. actinidiae TaxID=103796 RepID=A0AAN4QDA2_PSESF|nr:DNA-binding transcriptional regulator [Pseudomonas syringae pv. actinidiae]